MIEGCLDWQESGLIRPARVMETTQNYFEDQDLFRLWLEDECEADPGNDYRWERSADLFASWWAYAKAAGEHPGSLKNFGPSMMRHGMSPYRTKHVRGWSGVRLRTSLRSAGDGR